MSLAITGITSGAARIPRLRRNSDADPVESIGERFEYVDALIRLPVHHTPAPMARRSTNSVKIVLAIRDPLGEKRRSNPGARLIPLILSTPVGTQPRGDPILPRYGRRRRSLANVARHAKIVVVAGLEDCLTCLVSIGSGVQDSSLLGCPDGPAMDDSPMQLALALANEAMSLGEVPVGAVVTRNGRVLSQAHNLRETLHDPTAHAERIAITMAGRALGTWRLDGCKLFVTLEPCPMCAGAIVQARLSEVIFGAFDPKAGACSSLYRLADDPRLNHRAIVRGGVMAEECGEVLSQFFRSRRR
ncbi:MAG: cytosine/adenosine deaminase [Planctomycetota bacterium]|nr:cytosine/adenosine deaminase [Planctomycetota bacterium]